MPASSASDPRPPLAFRVGVTGSRHLKPEEIEALRAPVGGVLRRVRDMVATLGAEPAARAVYRRDDRTPHLRLLSPLAVGADRLVAEEAVSLGYSLLAPLPFAQADYETDFQDSIDAFRRLLGRAEVFALDGGRDRTEAASYEAVGRFVARNCDLLIAVWDGVSDDRRGGTGQIMQFAARETVPIWWIDIATGSARWIAKPAHLRHLRRAPEGAAAERALVEDLRAVILPPVALPRKPDGMMSWAAHHVRRFRGYETAPLTSYLHEPARLPKTSLWRAYPVMQKWLAYAPREEAEPAPPVAPEPPILPVEGWWAPIYDRADGLSVFYGDRYRSSYVLVIALAFCAVVVAALGGFLRGTWTPALPTLLELALLVGIGALVFANHIHVWQERWITYRLLAELCRKQMLLAILGRSLPGAEVNRAAAEAAAQQVDARAEPVEDAKSLPAREAWVGWYFLACQRAAPFPTGDMGTAAARALAIGRTFAAGQWDYHARRCRAAERAERRLAKIGEAFFLLTGSGLLLRLLVGSGGASRSLGSGINTVAVLLSGVSAAFVGLRAYSEFALLARQSIRMKSLMEEAQSDLTEIELGHPLASEELGGLLHRLAIAMMQEVRGWAQLFRLKSVETS